MGRTLCLRHPQAPIGIRPQARIIPWLQLVDPKLLPFLKLLWKTFFKEAEFKAFTTIFHKCL
jgi:hypothetical protein